jgi:hypothetical protein
MNNEELIKEDTSLKEQIKTKFTEKLVNDALNSFKDIDILKLVDTYNKKIDDFVKNNKCEEIEKFIEDLVWDALNNLAFEKECERQDAYEKALYTPLKN